MDVPERGRQTALAHNLSAVRIEEDLCALEPGGVRRVWPVSGESQPVEFLAGERCPERIEELRNWSSLRSGGYVKQRRIEDSIQIFLERHDAAGNAQHYHEEAGHESRVQVQVENQVAHKIILGSGLRHVQ